MSFKRSHSEFKAEEEAGESPTHDGGPSSKRWKPSGKGKAKGKEGTNIYARKRSRDIQRRLMRDQKLPADVRAGFEKELASLKEDVATNSFQKQRSAMISKYHMVRFFGESIPTPIPPLLYIRV